MAKSKSKVLLSEESKALTQEEFYQQYESLRPTYERLGVNLQQALKSFLSEKKIPYLDILFRIKEASSAYEKIARKKYNKPFDEIEDWCGLRIICYYPSDVDQINEILSEEFDVQTQEDTASRLAPHEFGYRSTHFIVTIKDSWMQSPNYRGLKNFKTEVQVRTILMHAWAEIEHKLSYKTTEQVPDQFKRQLYRLSAKFEEADEQFEALKNGIRDYRASLTTQVSDTAQFMVDDLNLDTLQALQDNLFPNRESNLSFTRDLFEELKSSKVNINDIKNAYDTVIGHFDEIESQWKKAFLKRSEQLSQVGAIRIVLDLANDNFYNFRHNDISASAWTGLVNDWKRKLNLIKDNK